MHLARALVLLMGSKVQMSPFLRHSLQVAADLFLFREHHLFALRHCVQLTSFLVMAPALLGSVEPRAGPVRVRPDAGPAMHLRPWEPQFEQGRVWSLPSSR